MRFCADACVGGPERVGDVPLGQLALGCGLLSYDHGYLDTDYFTALFFPLGWQGKAFMAVDNDTLIFEFNDALNLI